MSVQYTGNVFFRTNDTNYWFIIVFSSRDLYFWEDVRKKTIENFEKHKMSMMYVCRHTVAKDLHLRN